MRSEGSIQRIDASQRNIWRTGRFRFEWVLVFGALVVTLSGLFWKVGQIPHGVFADEALIGLYAQQFVDGDRDLSLFYDHYGTVSGSLPWLAVSPFVKILGLSPFSLRLSSVFICLGAVVLIYFHLRLLRVRHALLAIVVLLCSPGYFHIARITFGHAPGFFLLAAGFLLYTYARTRGYGLLSVVAGAVTTFSAYAYPGFLIAAPVFLGCVFLAEVFMTLRQRTQWKFPIALGIGGAMAFVPVIWEAAKNPLFLRRFEHKADLTGPDNGGVMSLDRMINAIQNYPKYFDFDFLFSVGESGLPESNFLRHSVVGAGLLPWVFLLLFPIGIAGLRYSADHRLARAALPMVLLAFAFPIPDSLTTDFSAPPYTFASAYGLFSVPFIAALAFATLEQWIQTISPRVAIDKGKVIRTCFGGLSFSLLIPAMVFVFSTYQAYPWHSSGFWGWQNGMDQVTKYYESDEADYQELMIQWTMDRPETLIAFYADNPETVETVNRGLPDPATAPEPGILYVISGPAYREEFDPEVWHIQQVVMNPDGSVAFVLASDQPSQAEAPGSVSTGEAGRRDYSGAGLVEIVSVRKRLAMIGAE